MTLTDDVKKIIQDQNDQDYSGNEPTGEDSSGPMDIDALAEQVLGNTIPEDKPLNIAEEIERDEKIRYGPPEKISNTIIEEEMTNQANDKSENENQE